MRKLLFLSLMSVALSAQAGTTIEDRLESTTEVARESQPQPSKTASVEIVRAEFGVLERTSTGVRFRPTSTVPARTGQNYAWAIKVKTGSERVRVTEIMMSPKAPLTWGSPVEGQVISEDGRVSTTVTEARPEEGVILKVWSYAEGDPKGDYTIKVIFDGGSEHTFAFRVE